MILDATAGNRTMWKKKDSELVIYIDIERKLEVKPTIFCDNTKTPFLDKTFNNIFYDPPHMYGDKSSFYVIPDSKTFKQKWQGYGEIPRYYGGDKEKYKVGLIAHLFYAQKELRRILKDDGLLWLKWNETKITLRSVLKLFEEWHQLMIIYVKSPTQTAGKHQTYWVCLCKKPVNYIQCSLY